MSAVAVRGDPIVRLACGHSHATAVTASGRLLMWGMKFCWQPIEILALSAGEGEAAAAEAARVAAAAGGGAEEEEEVERGGGASASAQDIISGATPARDAADLPAPLVAVRDVACGNNFTLALSAAGELWSFGKGRTRCLGVGGGDTVRADAPLRVGGELEGRFVYAVAAGDRHVAALVGPPPSDPNAEA